MSKRIRARALRNKVAARRRVIAPVVLGAAVVVISVFIFHSVLSRSIAPSTPLATITFYGRPEPKAHKSNSFTVEVRNVQAAADLLKATKQLPAMQAGAAACQADEGVYYKMTFKEPALTVMARTTACREVIVSTSPDVYQADAGFWKAVNQATGKPVYPGSTAKYF